MMPSRTLKITLLATTALMAGMANAQGWGEELPEEIVVNDPDIAAALALTYDRSPPEAVPGVDYGYDAATGVFTHPVATTLNDGAPRFEGQLEGWDQNTYASNVEEIAFYPHVTSPWHAWIDVADFDGRRYMYFHDRDYMRVLDVTDPAQATEVYSEGGVWGPDGSSEDFDSAAVQDYWGGITIAWSEALQSNVVVASYEIGRFGLLTDKLRQPDVVESLRHYNSLKGFRVYRMNGPLPSDWELIAERTTDTSHPDAPIGEQEGSGSLDAPTWFGGQYMYLAAAPTDDYALTDYPDYLHSPGYQVWDMSDPANPVFVEQITVPGQVVGDPESEAAWLMNPRAGNRTSWMGARMAPFLPEPVEDGGTVAFGGMAGLGLYSFDLTDPAHPAIAGHLNTPPSFAGTEFDSVDVSQYARTGFVFTNGYPMNPNCYEPYKDIYVVDARDPAAMEIVATLPRPVPPEGAGFTDYCQRGGSFGPKRSGGMFQPGDHAQGILPYAFYNAGLQLFDVTDPTAPSIAGYFVPRFPTTEEMPDWTFDNAAFAIFTEYDRNIIWLVTVGGVYALSTPLLGEPMTGTPEAVWPPRD
ncbi:MAG: hypothetical protein IT542_05565 [Rubellimicrobium sp.]|nr:hypothetical protein [Rubellimicrobium sp.]